MFRYDDRMKDRRENGAVDLSLALAREKLIDAQRAFLEGRSPAQEKQREKRHIREAKSCGAFGERCLQEHRMAESTGAMPLTGSIRVCRPLVSATFSGSPMSGLVNTRSWLCALTCGRGVWPSACQVLPEHLPGCRRAKGDTAVTASRLADAAQSLVALQTRPRPARDHLGLRREILGSQMAKLPPMNSTLIMRGPA